MRSPPRVWFLPPVWCDAMLGRGVVIAGDAQVAVGPPHGYCQK